MKAGSPAARYSHIFNLVEAALGRASAGYARGRGVLRARQSTGPQESLERLSQFYVVHITPAHA